MNFDEISPELQARARACKTPEDILKLAKEMDYKLSDEELDAISGGDVESYSCWGDCPSYVCTRDYCHVEC